MEGPPSSPKLGAGCLDSQRTLVTDGQETPACVLVSGPGKGGSDGRGEERDLMEKYRSVALK